MAGNFKPTLLGSIRIYGSPLEGETRAPSLQFGSYKNQVQVTVWTGKSTDKDKGRIQVSLDPRDFFTFLGLVQYVIEAPNGARESLEVLTFPWDRSNNRRSKEPKLDARLTVGKSDDGVIWVALLSWDKDRPKIQFPFKTSRLTKLIHASTGESWSDAEITKLNARQFVKLFGELMPAHLMDSYEPPEPRENQGGGGYSSGGQNNSAGAKDDFEGLPL